MRVGADRNTRGLAAEQLMKIAVDTKEFEVTRVPSTGVPVKVVIPVIDGDRPSGYWLPRSEFRRLLYDEASSRSQDRRAMPTPPWRGRSVLCRVEIYAPTVLKSIKAEISMTLFQVTVQS